MRARDPMGVRHHLNPQNPSIPNTSMYTKGCFISAGFICGFLAVFRKDWHILRTTSSIFTRSVGFGQVTRLADSVGAQVSGAE